MSTFSAKDIVENRKDALSISRRMAEAGISRTRLHSDKPNGSVRMFVKELLEEGRKTGKVLTRAMRLSGGNSAILLECLNGTDPYNSSDLNLKIVVQNFGKTPVKVLVDQEWHPDVTDTGEELDSGFMERIFDYVQPGETRTLPATKASHVLHAHSREAWTAMWQDKWPGDRDCVREIGYTYEIGAKSFTAPDPQEKRSK